MIKATLPSDYFDKSIFETCTLLCCWMQGLISFYNCNKEKVFHTIGVKLFLSLIFLVLFSPCFAQTIEQEIEGLIEKSEKLSLNGDFINAESTLQMAVQYAEAKGAREQQLIAITKLLYIKIEQQHNADVDSLYGIGLTIAQKVDKPLLTAKLRNVRARQFMYNGEFDDANALFNKVWEVYKTLGNTSDVGQYYNDMGYMADRQAIYDEAVKWYLKAVDVFEHVADSNGLANTLGNLSVSYHNLLDPEKAKFYAHKSLNIRSQTGDVEGMTVIFNNLSRMFQIEGQIDSAKFYQQENIKLASKSGKRKNVADAYVNMSMIFHAEKKYDLAIEQIKRAIAIAEEINHSNLANFYRMCALYHGKLGDEVNMEKYYALSYDLIVKNRDKTQFRDYYATRMNYFKSKGDFENAFSNYEKYVAYKDSVVNEVVQANADRLEIEYETQKKATQLETAEKDKIKQQLRYNVIISFLLLSLVIGALLFIRYRYKKSIERNTMIWQERNRIAAELHDELGSNLSAINMITHEYSIRKKDEVARGVIIGKVNKNTQQMMESLSDIVWSMNPDNDTVGSLIAKMREFTAHVLEATEINYLFDVNIQENTRLISGEKRRDLYLIFKEALNNVAKHSKANFLKIEIKQTKEKFVLSMEDDGVGFSDGTNRLGNGLKNMKARASRHKGVFRLESNEPKGLKLYTEIYLTHHDAMVNENVKPTFATDNKSYFL